MKVPWLWHTAGSGFIIWPEGHAKAGQVIPDNHLMSGLVFGKGYRLALVLTKSCLGRERELFQPETPDPSKCWKTKGWESKCYQIFRS